MAVTWNFMPSFIDVLGYHHDPKDAQHDPNLVEIIATIEHFLLTKGDTTPVPGGEALPQAQDQNSSDGPIPLPAQKNLPAFADTHPPAVAEMLDKEYARLLPLVELGLTSTIGGNG
jgi:hypothetical protein